MVLTLKLGHGYPSIQLKRLKVFGMRTQDIRRICVHQNKNKQKTKTKSAEELSQDVSDHI